MTIDIIFPLEGNRISLAMTNTPGKILITITMYKKADELLPTDHTAELLSMMYWLRYEITVADPDFCGQGCKSRP